MTASPLSLENSLDQHQPHFQVAANLSETVAKECSCNISGTMGFRKLSLRHVQAEENIYIGRKSWSEVVTRQTPLLTESYNNLTVLHQYIPILLYWFDYLSKYSAINLNYLCSTDMLSFDYI